MCGNHAFERTKCLAYSPRDERWEQVGVNQSLMGFVNQTWGSDRHMAIRNQVSNNWGRQPKRWTQTGKSVLIIVQRIGDMDLGEGRLMSGGGGGGGEWSSKDRNWVSQGWILSCCFLFSAWIEHYRYPALTRVLDSLCESTWEHRTGLIMGQMNANTLPLLVDLLR